ncbi:hypothetical protein V6N11_082111 [Hibiscus sabdariffa]|uniref:DUF4283 domain-containing protein n=1 Tax=Hibiscus sabdariffa TaxID=183260 RepID=A0ABR2QH03_9ROSI
MGDRTDCFSFHSFLLFVYEVSLDSRRCESRSRLYLGRRLVRLEGPLLGHRQPCRLRCQVWDEAHGSGGSFRCGKGSLYFSVLQDPAWCFASDDWYGVWGSLVSVFSVDVDGLFFWFFAGKMEGESDDGSIACGVVIGHCYMKALLWGTLKMRLGRVNLNEVFFDKLGFRIRVPLTGEILIGWWTVYRDDGLPVWLGLVAESGSFSNSGFISLVMERQGWWAERGVVVVYLGKDCLVAGWSLEDYQRAVGLGIDGQLAVGCFVVRVLKEVWPWWREFSDSKEVWTWPRWSLWCALQGVWMGLWWRYRQKKVWIASLKGFEWWLWGFPRGSKMESMGRGEVAGEDVGKHGFSCMTWMERACTWGLSREVSGPTGGLFSGFVVQRGTFPWERAVIGMAGNQIWPSGACERPQCLVIRCVLDSKGLVRRVLECRVEGLERGVLKIDESVRVKRCVLLAVWRRIKRCVFGVSVTASRRARWGIARGFLTYLKWRSVCRGSSMAEEVVKLMSNLNFSEEELIEVEPMEGLGQEQQSETEKWVVVKLVTRRKFGEWLRVPLIRKRNGSQGDRRQSIIYTDKEMGGVGKGKQSEGNMQAGPRGGGRGQQGNGTYIRPRGPKRVLQGKYEVCTPVGSKKARASSSLVIEDDGNLEVMSPLKTTSTVEAVEQPRREP